MSTTTPAGDALRAALAELPARSRRGLDVKGDRVRLRMQFRGATKTALLEDVDAAILLRAEWRAMKGQGLMPDDHDDLSTVRDYALALFDRKRLDVSRKTRRRLSERGLDHWAQILRPWIEGPFANVPVHLLNRNRVEDAIRLRAEDHPKAAADELGALKAVLRFARSREAAIASAVLDIDAPVRVVREREALSLEDLDLLAWSAPAYAVRAILFAGTTGLRWNELVSLRTGDVDLEAGTVTIPDAGTKERQGDKVVDLFDDEVALLREQMATVRDVAVSRTSRLPARPVGCDLVFPARDGGRYAHHQFLRLVWYKARARAAATWQAERGVPRDPASPTPFTWLHPDTGRATGITPHDLRSTAVTLMMRADFPVEVTAARIGHHDGGALVRKIYDRSSARERTRGAVHGRPGLRAGGVDEAAAGRHYTPANAASPNRPEGIG